MSDAATPENTIAFQGRPGAYSHLSCREAKPEMNPLSCNTFADAFAEVREGGAGLAMIPIENSLGGRVADVHHLLPESGLYIVGEHFHKVQHHLLAVPGAKLEELKEVRSHEQALSQCRGLIRELGLQARVVLDTAGAAHEVAELADPKVAAIASSLAGEIYGLESLRSRIEDVIGNTTRMVLLARRPSEPDPNDGPAITSLIFQVRSVPAALYKALGGFATNGVNVVKLESYITDDRFTVAQFYVELEGHAAHKNVERALEELQYFATKLKILGVYPANAYRFHH